MSKQSSFLALQIPALFHRLQLDPVPLKYQVLVTSITSVSSSADYSLCLSYLTMAKVQSQDGCIWWWFCDASGGGFVHVCARTCMCTHLEVMGHGGYLKKWLSLPLVFQGDFLSK